jgi:hypothetical protein
LPRYRYCCTATQRYSNTYINTSKAAVAIQPGRRHVCAAIPQDRQIFSYCVGPIVHQYNTAKVAKYVLWAAAAGPACPTSAADGQRPRNRARRARRRLQWLATRPAAAGDPSAPPISGLAHTQKAASSSADRIGSEAPGGPARAPTAPHRARLPLTGSRAPGDAGATDAARALSCRLPARRVTRSTSPASSKGPPLHVQRSHLCARKGPPLRKKY